MSITLGQTSFDVDDLDMLDFYLRLMFGHAALRPYMSAIVEDIGRNRRRRVMEYDCKTGEATLFKVIEKERAVVMEFRPYVVGLSKKGKPTNKAKKALRDALVDKTGLSSAIEIEGQLRKLFGTYKEVVPIDDFFKAYGKNTSFHVDMYVYWDMLRITLPADLPSGDFLVAFPYAVQFQGEAVYDCKKKKRFDAFREETFHYLPIKPWVPASPDARKAALRAIEADLTSLEGQMEIHEGALKKAKEKLLENASDKRAKADANSAKRSLKKKKQRSKHLTEVRNAMRG